MTNTAYTYDTSKIIAALTCMTDEIVPASPQDLVHIRVATMGGAGMVLAGIPRPHTENMTQDVDLLAAFGHFDTMADAARKAGKQGFNIDTAINNIVNHSAFVKEDFTPYLHIEGKHGAQCTVSLPVPDLMLAAKLKVAGERQEPKDDKDLAQLCAFYEVRDTETLIARAYPYLERFKSYDMASVMWAAEAVFTPPSAPRPAPRPQVNFNFFI